MKKKNAIIALLLAGALSFGMFGTAACHQKPESSTDTQGEQQGDNQGDNQGEQQGGQQGGNQGEQQGGNQGGNQGGDQSGDQGGSQGGDQGGDQSGDQGGSQGGDQGGEEFNKPVVFTSNTALSVTVGEVKTLAAPAAGTTWTVDDPTVATVDSNGNVTAKTAGVAKVKAKYGNNEVTCTVIVLDKLQGSQPAPEKQPFSFDGGSVDIDSISTPTIPSEPIDQDADEYKVTFSDGATAQYVAKGGMAVAPIGVEKDGYFLRNWKSGNNAYDFASPVTQPVSLTANWAALPSGIEKVQGNQENIVVEFVGSHDKVVQYAVHGQSAWTTVDAELVRSLDGSSSRVDILGLKAGCYDVKVGDTLISEIYVTAQDRSGYAHFNYDKGIGAYNDDGTLKDNALVIYVTEENKDTVMDAVCAANSDVPMFQIPGSDWGGKNASGIGWWLNNNQYTASNANSDKNKQPSNTYDAANGSKLSFKAVDRPIVIRFIGKVSTPEGCTAYDSTNEGGGVGDNGHMARMKDLKNITLEGVGEDAMIYGWGFHFVKGGTAANGQGESFEVRNLTFSEYPEDAIGMEGQQEGSTITAGVERCWVHNNTFLPGHCANPAESDKAEGDGSCDFKRGQYFTCSYNYFEYCHKTNLIGSSDSSLQYNLTYHHNMWYQCGSRIPLTRQANVHFYNNYVCGDLSEGSTPYSWISKPALSYVHSLRANCYLFSEANYYEGMKQVTDGKSGGAGKAWNNTYTTCFGANTLVAVSSRDQKISNSCKYGSTDYSAFDTNTTQFYYDSTNKRSDCLLDDSVAARTRVLQYVGRLGFGETKLSKLNANKDNPSSAVQVANGGTTVNMSNASGGKVESGVLFNSGFKGGKGKGQLATFTLTAPTQVTISTSTTGETAPDLVRSDGRVFAARFTGNLTVVLPAGTYFVTAGQKDKEANITAMSFADTAASAEARINAAKAALARIPDKITRNDAGIINEAGSAYSALLPAEREQIDQTSYERYLKAKQALDNIEVQYVIARIDYIGTVTEYSAKDIEEASKAYKALPADKQASVTNYAKLNAAISEFSKFASQNVKNEIKILPVQALFNKIKDSAPAVELVLDLYNKVLEDYNGLDGNVQEQVNDITKVKDGIAALKGVLVEAQKAEEAKQAYVEFVQAMGEITDVQSATADQMKKVMSLYYKLTDAQKGEFTDNKKFTDLKAKYEAEVPKSETILFYKGAEYPNTVTIVKDEYKSKVSFTYEGNTYDCPLKMQSGTSVTFEVATDCKVRIGVDVASKSIIVDGEKVKSDGNKEVVVELKAGQHVLTKGDSINLCYIIIGA